MPTTRQIISETLPFFVAATAFKVLLFPAYHSTDFEVHRNWLAITNSLPITEWYYEKTSEWTLDYPPFFAYGEWLLSHVARIVDPQMVMVQNLGYDGYAAVYFQRSSVVVTELVLGAALFYFIRSARPMSTASRKPLALSLLLSPALLIIDHIHFQYNGFLFGLLVLSLVSAQTERGRLLSGALFAILLCFKHIYLYIAPAYFVYLLRAYCLHQSSIFRPKFMNTIKLGSTIIGIFALAFGPFALWEQMPQLLSRLFPFSRGLNHAYWAPNFWALYSLSDRLILPLASRLNLPVDEIAINSVTRGLVGDTAFTVLPNITPRICFIITLGLQLISLVKLFFSPAWDVFVAAVTLCGYASFLAGWHVHEKAILLVIFPFSLIAVKNQGYFKAFRLLIVAGHVSLFPLLFRRNEFPIKLIYTTVWLLTSMTAYDSVTPASESRRSMTDRAISLYNLGFIPLVVYTSTLHELCFGLNFAFLPLMMISTYSAVGVIGSWLLFNLAYFRT